MFLVELSGLEFISEAVGTITKVGSNFISEVKKRGNKEQAGYSKKELDIQSALLHRINVL